MAHFLILGSGSVGKRHARNLATLGSTVSAMDTRDDRLDELDAEVKLAGRFLSVEDALAAGGFDGVVVASPPHVHVAQSIAALRHGLPVLLEKPVAPTLADAAELAAAAASAKVPLLLGYTWRWWPPFADLWRLLDAGRIGALRHVRFTLSAHLADWHPWERYQDFFMSQAALGGGALLDESHWIDLMIWFFGMPKTVFARIDHISDLEISTDDNVDLLFGFDGGLRVAMHLDLYGRPHEKSIRFVGEAGSIHWTDAPNRLRVAQGAADEWEDSTYTCERNDMFMAVCREFTEVVAGRAAPTCTLDDGLRVLRVIEAARLSHAERRIVDIDPVN